jgi:hypothetical protein
MTRKNRLDFRTQEDWLRHVRREIAAAEQPYALALGRLDLFRAFYQTLGTSFPAQFSKQLRRIEMMHALERTAALDVLNEAIMGSLTVLLSNRSRSVTSDSASEIPASARNQIQELVAHLEQKNRCFALWTVYRLAVSGGSVLEKWDQYLLRELGCENAEEIAFAHAMVELDRLLALFHDQNRELPSFAFERIWFLHYLRGPERMAQTRAVLGMLTAELEACTSA